MLRHNLASIRRSFATGRKSSSCCASLAAHASHLGRSSFRSPMRNYFKYFLTSSLVLITAFSCIFCLNIFEKYLRLASVRYLSRRLPFFYFYDSIRGLIGPFASSLDFIISLFCCLAFGRIRRFDLVLFATPCRFYLASLVILIVLSLHTFPARFRLCLSFRFRFLCPALSFAFVFPCSCSCSFPPRFPFPRSFPFPVSLSRLPVPSPVRCVPSPSPVPSPCPVFCPASRLPPVSLVPFSRCPCSVLSFWCRVCVRSLRVRSFVRCSFVRSGVRSVVRSFVRSCARPSFVRSLGSFPAFPVLLPVLFPPSPYFPSPSVLLSLLL